MCDVCYCPPKPCRYLFGDITPGEEPDVHYVGKIHLGMVRWGYGTSKMGVRVITIREICCLLDSIVVASPITTEGFRKGDCAELVLWSGSPDQQVLMSVRRKIR